MGWLDVEEMMDQIPEWKFARWETFLRVDPQGGTRGDMQAGIVASTIANVNRRKNAEPFKLTNFMMDIPLGKKDDSRPKQQSLEELKSQMKSIHNTQQQVISNEKKRKNRQKKRKQDKESYSNE